MSSFIGFPINASKQASEKSAILRHTEITRACSIDSSNTMQDYEKYFNSKWKLWKKLYETSDIEIWGIKSQINKNKLSMAKIFKHTHNKKQLRHLMEQYICITNNCLLVYEGIFYSKKQSFVLIVMERLHKSLASLLINNPNNSIFAKNIDRDYHQKREIYVKHIALQILDKIWILHNNNYVHTQIMPSHIMLRDCNKWENEANKLHHVIKNGWKLIGFNHIATNDTKLNAAVDNKMIGWSAPEIDVRKKANKVTFAADIWSFGLVILKLLIGYQPFELHERTEKLLSSLSSDKSNKGQKLRNKIRKEWYLNKIICGGQLYLTRFLETLYSKQIISMELFTLLCAGMLRFNPTARWNSKQIYNSMWFNDVITLTKKRKPTKIKIENNIKHCTDMQKDDIKTNDTFDIK